MAMIKCKMCGGDLEIIAENSVATAKDEPAAFYHDARERAALCREKGLEAGYKYACRMMHHGTFSHTLERYVCFKNFRVGRMLKRKSMSVRRLLDS